MMRKLIVLTLIILTAACARLSETSEYSISGEVINPGFDHMLLLQGRNADTIFLQEDGTFEFSDTLDMPGDFYLRFDNKTIPLYLAPWEHLYISFDTEYFPSSVEFTGGLAKENEFLMQADAFNREQSSIIRKYYEAAPEEYLRVMDSLSKAENKLLDDYYGENPEMDAAFVESRKVLNEFSYYSALLNYEAIHTYYAKVDSVELPTDWYAFLDNIKLDDPGYIKVPVSLNVINTIINKRIEDENGLGDDAWGTVELLEKQFDYVVTNFESQELINHFLFTNLSTHIDARGTDGAEDLIEQFYLVSTDEEEKEAIRKKAEEWAHLSRGMPAPEFALPDINGDMVSLADFKGKYVYIDFWATWCGPCKIEIPYLEKMTEEYKDKNLEIISISVDRDKQAWIDMVTEDQPQWIQLHDSIMINDEYLVKYIPTFVLIDREGKIIDARAHRPSSGDLLTDQLNSLEGI